MDFRKQAERLNFFLLITKVTELYFSCLQIYNEKLSDLLSPSNKIRLREKSGKFIVNNLSDQKVMSAESGNELIGKCEMNRNIGSTSMNPYSSRSHAIYMFKVLHKTKGIVSNLYFIDLAGSERLKVNNFN